jgi:DNA-binding Xre family transcriptional regulator
MPKLALSLTEKKNRSLRAGIEYAQTVQGINKAKLALMTGIPYSTLCLRLQHPEQLRIGELREMCRALKMKPEDLERLARDSL